MWEGQTSNWQKPQSREKRSKSKYFYIKNDGSLATEAINGQTTHIVRGDIVAAFRLAADIIAIHAKRKLSRN
jgi:hypothetical protein